MAGADGARKRKSEALSAESSDDSHNPWHAEDHYEASSANLRRLLVCILVDDAGWSVSEACELAHVPRSTFNSGNWLKKFRNAKASNEDAFEAVLHENRGGARAGSTKMSPHTKKVVVDAARRGVPVGEMVAVQEEYFEETGQDGREPAGPRAVQRALLSDDMEYVRDGRPPLVQTPWSARWRLEFSNEWLPRFTEEPALLRKTLFSDEKKFALYKTKGGRWAPAEILTHHGARCVAREEEMTDQQYKDWRAAHKGEVLPTDKSRGLYPIFVWGAVGYNMKSKLFVLEEKEKLTAKRYAAILADNENGLAEMVTRNADKLGGDGLYAMDNDVKHSTPESLAVLKGLGLSLLASRRWNEAGDAPDRQAAHFGHLKTYDGFYFPTYSPDINQPIEKVWAEVQRRVLRRVGDIKSRADMIQVVRQEWNELEFDKSDRWCGINYLVMQTPDVLEEVIAQDGFDTSFMK